MRYAIKHSITFILALGLTLLLNQAVTTQTDIPSPNLHQWGAITLFHGLPSDHVRAISQDSDGVMWFGTDAGLVRYDGRRVQRISTEGPASNRIRAIKLDPDGALWIGTDTGAARVINDDIKLIPQTENKIVTSVIVVERGRAIFTTEQGAILDCSIASNGSFTVRAINSEDHPSLRVESLNRPLTLTAIIAKDDSIIVGSRSRGLLSVQGERIDEIPLRPRPFFIETIARDSAGRFWIGAQTSIDDTGLYQSADLRRASKIGAGLGTVTSIAFDEQSEMWVGTDRNGAFHFRGESLIEHFTFNTTAGGLRSNHIYSTFVDREGVIWFGTDRGACRYDPRSPRSEIISAEPESNFVRALFQSSDRRVWCGANRGLFLREETSWRQVDELRGKTVHAISQDSDGRFIIGTASGLFVSDDGAQFSRLAEGEIIRALGQFQGATYIANFNRGLERLDANERALVLPARQIISLHADKNQMWIGTANAGALVFDGKQATTPPELESLRDAAVRSIAVSQDGAVWFATSRGLYALRSGALTPVIEGVDARQVIVENDQAWCATEAGLYTALIDEDAGAIASRMSAEQGLPSQNVFALMSRSNELWIGTNRGAARYTPNRAAPAIKVARLLAQRAYSRQEIRAGVRLEYPQNSLSVEVAAASSRTFPEQFQYRFSLISSGREVKSRLSREPSFSVENLRPGRYEIIARAITGDLAQSDSLSIRFEVESAPFPWTTAALSLLLALALAAIAWGYYQNKRLTRTNEALEGANLQLAETRMQLANETEAERRRIARDLHDQTLADLRRLLLLADEMPLKIESGESLIDPLVLRREIESISTEIRRICEDLSPSALENVGLAAALEYALSDAVAHLPAERRFEYEFACREGIEERLRLSPVVQIQIYRIFQEAISNVSRHASAGRVRLSIEEMDGGFILTLEDDGCGFDPRSKRTGRGIANIISRASLIEAAAEWTEREGGGTRFILRKGIKAD